MRIPIITIVLFTLCVVGCGRSNPGVAVINIDEIFKEYEASREMYEQLQKEKADFETKGQSMLEEINTLVKEKELLSNEARKEREVRIAEKSAALEAFRRGATMSLMEKTNAEYQKLMADIQAASEAVAKRRGIKMILDTSIVAYSAKSMDVTKELVAELNRRQDPNRNK